MILRLPFSLRYIVQRRLLLMTHDLGTNYCLPLYKHYIQIRLPICGIPLCTYSNDDKSKQKISSHSKSDEHEPAILTSSSINVATVKVIEIKLLPDTQNAIAADFQVQHPSDFTANYDSLDGYKGPQIISSAMLEDPVAMNDLFDSVQQTEQTFLIKKSSIHILLQWIESGGLESGRLKSEHLKSPQLDSGRLESKNMKSEYLEYEQSESEELDSEDRSLIPVNSSTTSLKLTKFMEKVQTSSLRNLTPIDSDFIKERSTSMVVRQYEKVRQLKHYEQKLRNLLSELFQFSRSVPEVQMNQLNKLLEDASNGCFDINALGISDGGTPLHLAARSGHVPVVKAVLAAGAQINARSFNWATPLHWAAGNGHADVVEFLLTEGADPTLRTITWKTNVYGSGSGQTAAHWAAESGHLEVLKILEHHNEIVLAMEDERGNTTLDLAGKECKLNTISFLKKKIDAEQYLAVSLQLKLRAHTQFKPNKK